MSVNIPSKRMALIGCNINPFDDVPGVYFLFKKGRLLYIGFGSAVGTRLRSARRAIYSHFGVIKCKSPIDAHELEIQAIHELRPPHNRLILSPSKHIPGIERKWNARQNKFRTQFIKKLERQAVAQEKIMNGRPQWWFLNKK